MHCAWSFTRGLLRGPFLPFPSSLFFLLPPSLSLSLPSFPDLLRTSHMSAAALDARDRAMNKTAKIHALIGGILRVGQWEE